MSQIDDDVLRELLHRATEDLHAPPAVTAGIVIRHRRRLRNTRMLSITTTSVAAAALLAAVLVNVRDTTFESPGTGAVLEQDFGLGGIAVYTSVTGSAALPASLRGAG